MAKVALITDTHFGVHGNSDVFLKSQLKFFKKEFVPYLKKHNITRIFHLGDFWDNRSTINIRLKNIIMELFDNELKDFKITMLIGNHDSYFKNNIETHSLKFLDKYPNVDVIEDIKLLSIANRKVLLVPWQCDEDQFKNRIANNNIFCDVMLGHLPIMGFKLNNKRVNEHGLDTEILFNNYNLVFSGHFHTRSNMQRAERKIEYIGNPYQLTFSDEGDERGFCILDLETLNYEFINNNTSLKFKTVVYPEPLYKKDIRGNVIKLEVNYDQEFSEEEIEKYIDTCEGFKPAILPITIDRKSNIQGTSEDYKAVDLLELIDEYLDEIKMVGKKDVYENIENVYSNLHNEKDICL
jgi:DNA repair exonuclease SbcCD nuclease subunit